MCAYHQQLHSQSLLLLLHFPEVLQLVLLLEHLWHSDKKVCRQLQSENSIPKSDPRIYMACTCRNTFHNAADLNTLYCNIQQFAEPGSKAIITLIL